MSNSFKRISLVRATFWAGVSAGVVTTGDDAGVGLAAATGDGVGVVGAAATGAGAGVTTTGSG